MKWKKALVFALFLICVKGYSYIHPNPGGWGIKAEFLYLKPSLDDTYFVIDSDGTGTLGNPNGRRVDNDFHFEPGFSLEAAYTLCDPCDLEFHLAYSYLNAKASQTVTGTDLFATVGFPTIDINFDAFTGEATSRNHLHWHNLEGYVQHNIWNNCCCGIDLYARAGLQFFSVHYDERVRYNDTVNTIIEDFTKELKTWGIGPQFGFQLEYDLCQFECGCGNLSLVALTTGSLLVSKVRSSFGDSGIIETVDNDNDPKWRIVPAWLARIGFNYGGCCDNCFGYSFDIGYQFQTYHKAVQKIIFMDDIANGLSFDQTLNFDLHGLYIALGLTF